MIPLKWTRIVKLIDRGNILGAPSAGQRGEWGILIHGQRVSALDQQKVLEMGGGDCTWRECT